LKTLLYYHSGLDTASAYYRGVGELAKIRKDTGHQFEIIPERSPAINRIVQADGIFLERPYTQDHYDVVLHARLEGIPVWIDYDDFLYDIPESNPCHSTYTDSAKDRIEKITALADYVSFSTVNLMNQMRIDGKENYVINNGLPKEQSWINRIEKSRKEKTILWRGSETHSEDLMSVMGAIIQFANEHPEVKFEFMGYSPWFLTKYLPKWQFLGGVPLGDYFISMARMSPDAVIVPLVNSDFNLCKSNIAGLEATSLSDSLVICPSFLEWQGNGWTNYESEESFYNSLNHVLQLDTQSRTGLVEKSKNLITEKYGDGSVDSVSNETRKEILERMQLI
jgi:hypothetical protein